MLNLNKRLRPLLILCALALPQAAFAQQYFCTINSAGGTSGWVPPEFLIEYSGSTATITHGWVEGPAVNQTQIRGNNTRRRLNYSIANVSAFGTQRTTMIFQLVHNVGTNELRVTVNPAEYSNRFSGRGACAPV